MLSLLGYEIYHLRLRRRRAVERDKICEVVNHRQGRGLMRHVDCSRWAMFTQKPMSTTGEGSVPLPLDLAIDCTLTDCFGGSKERGKRRETRHAAGKVSVEYGVELWTRESR